MRIFNWTLVCLAITPLFTGPLHAQPALKPPPRFPALSPEKWKQLHGDMHPAPAWARTLAQPLPRTTEAMLHLDFIHRAKNPLGPILAGKLHWAAADALGCEYGKRYAEADLRRAGLKDDDLKKLAGDPEKLSPSDQAALAFARKLTKAAYTVRDDEVAALLKQFGPENVVAMVHTLAWANFQNRIVLALGVAVEPDGPLPPFDPQVDAEKQVKLIAPARPSWKEAQAANAAKDDVVRPDWKKQTDAELAVSLDRQKARKPRIPVPASMPKDPKARPTRIVWTQVSMGYQPLLTKTWFDTMGTFQQEAKLDAVFSNSMFWVITRSNECFY